MVVSDHSPPPPLLPSQYPSTSLIANFRALFANADGAVRQCQQVDRR